MLFQWHTSHSSRTSLKGETSKGLRDCPLNHQHPPCNSSLRLFLTPGAEMTRPQKNNRNVQPSSKPATGLQNSRTFVPAKFSLRPYATTAVKPVPCPCCRLCDSGRLGVMLPWANPHRAEVELSRSRRSAGCRTSSVCPSCTAGSKALRPRRPRPGRAATAGQGSCWSSTARLDNAQARRRRRCMQFAPCSPLTSSRCSRPGP